jgi:hopanoid biosynthesis associated protein HpnK
MARPDQPRRLIVNADDFGRSHSINDAVIRAHHEGILTTASLMVNGHAFDHAVRLARENPTLGVGLHLSLVCDRSTLKPTEIPSLVDNRYNFTDSPVWAGVNYFFRPRIRAQLRHEIHAQFQRFQTAGLTLDHVNGHLNLHLHPTILSLLTRHSREWQVRQMRLTRDPLWLNLRLAGGHYAYRLSHALIFRMLCLRSCPMLKARGILHTRYVFGLLQNSRVDERYLLRLLSRLPAGDQEIYSHPCSEEFPQELAALVSPRVRETVHKLGIQLIRYQDL